MVRTHALSRPAARRVLSGFGTAIAGTFTCVTGTAPAASTAKKQSDTSTNTSPATARVAADRDEWIEPAPGQTLLFQYGSNMAEATLRSKIERYLHEFAPAGTP